jgi:hypothetical protein
VIFRWTDVNRSTRSKRGSHLLRRNEEIATFYDLRILPSEMRGLGRFSQDFAHPTHFAPAQ